MSTTWVTTTKSDEKTGEMKKKARLVRGFPEDLDRPEKESPIVTREVVRLFLSATIPNEWILKAIDIKTAFLQGKNLKREIIVRPPKDVRKTNVVWGLKKPVSGLQGAPRQGYLRVREEVVGAGMKSCPFEPALFFFG